ncbi:MAG: DUF368 domain-containing protein [Lachnospiraceae bacterium]|nr:DUF368 domain-containing protein [Lachnospiraceae bacterium]
MIRQFINGICMALADSVPGVSGGTIAFILGFYDRFIGSINDLVYEKGAKRKKAFLYLIKLGAGWIFGMICAVLILASAFESHIYMVSSLFMGFIIASIPIVVKEERESFVQKKSNLLFGGIGIIIVVGITLCSKVSFLTGISMNALSIPMMIYVFLAGMIAISAMFLPGISGSTLLLILGLYLPVISGVKELLHMQLSYFPGLCIFGCGVIAGALSVVKGIKTCLERYRSKTMYTILGLMIGSLYAIVMGPTTLDIPQAALGIHNFNVIAFVIGIVLVVLLQIIGKKNEQKKVGEEGN